MASPSDFSNGEVMVKRQSKGPPFKFLVPLIYAPILPLIRIGLRRNPVMRDRLFFAVLAGGFLHGSYLSQTKGFFGQVSPAKIASLKSSMKKKTDLYDSESK